VSRAPFEGLLGVEFAVMLLGGGHNPAAFHEVGGRRIAHDEALVAGAVTSLRAGNEQAGVTLETTTDGPVDAWISPIETVSNSESGFELVYQGSCVLLHRQVELAPGASATIRVEQRALAAVDHAVPATAAEAAR
jgi:alpha-amylase